MCGVCHFVCCAVFVAYGVILVVCAVFVAYGVCVLWSALCVVYDVCCGCCVSCNCCVVCLCVVCSVVLPVYVLMFGLSGVVVCVVCRV